MSTGYHPYFQPPMCHGQVPFPMGMFQQQQSPHPVFPFHASLAISPDCGQPRGHDQQLPGSSAAITTHQVAAPLFQNPYYYPPIMMQAPTFVDGHQPSSMTPFHPFMMQTLGQQAQQGVSSLPVSYPATEIDQSQQQAVSPTVPSAASVIPSQEAEGPLPGHMN